MRLSEAVKIQFSDFTKMPAFREICNYAECAELCSQHHIMGSDVDCMEYVKQADFANEKQKQVWGIPSLEFVLYYMCDGDRFVPFSLLENAAGKIIDKYNVLSQDHTQGPVDEQMAMAAVLMVTIGYELQKLFVLRSQVKVHQQKLLNVDSPSAPIRRLALPDEYTKYHIDMVDEQDGVICRGFQFEKYSAYYDCLMEKRDISILTPRMKALLDSNREKQNAFLNDFAPHVELIDAVYSAGYGRSIVKTYDMIRRVPIVGIPIPPQSA